MNPWLAIVNPVAGLPGATRALLRRLTDEYGSRCDIATTAHRGDGTRLAREAAAYEGLLVVGGDGTIAEVLNGMARSRQRLALLPAGHGNCLARDLGIGTAGRAFAAFEDMHVRALDLMRVMVEFADGRRHELLAASTLAVGYVADVAATGRRRFAWLGRHAYTIGSLLTLPRELELQVGADAAALRSRRLTNLVINNTAHLANFRAFRRARLDDGQLDVLEARFRWARQLLHNAAILAGSERFGPQAAWQTPAVTIAGAAPLRLMVDGELLQAVRRVSVRCEPAAVRCHAAGP